MFQLWVDKYLSFVGFKFLKHKASFININFINIATNWTISWGRKATFEAGILILDLEIDYVELDDA